MEVLWARNVHAALPMGVRLVKSMGVSAKTRYGDVLVVPHPVTTVYREPTERVVFWPERDANPFFHFYEALWMLGGRNDVASLSRFAKIMTSFSDDGYIFHGAYGHRWRRHFDMDQLRLIGERLRADHTDRRQVLAMWDARADLIDQFGKKDLPCNLNAKFQVVDGKLNMGVDNRSNDIVWGLYGANAVHFSMLQEFMAAVVGVPVGKYWHVSFNYHAYLNTLVGVKDLDDKDVQYHRVVQWENPYESGRVEPFNMVNGPADIWLQDLDMFLDEEENAIGYRDAFFKHVALPLVRAHRMFKDKAVGHARFDNALGAASNIKASDWRKAVEEWITRRKDNAK